MSLEEQVTAQAALLAGSLDQQQTELLKLLSRAAVSGLRARLREGLTPEDCKADFIAAASLFALASMNEAGQQLPLEELRAGNLTIRPGKGDAASRALANQAELMIMPYLRDSFRFLGV